MATKSAQLFQVYTVDGVLRVDVDKHSIKAILAACEAFETALGFGVLQTRLERDLRERFEAEARKQLGGLEYHSASTESGLRDCDTVDEMVAVLRAAVGDVTAVRVDELVRELRVDTEKLWGHYYLTDLLQAVKGVELGRRLDYFLAAFNRKGLCLSSAPSGYALEGYQQKAVLGALARLLVLLGSTARPGDAGYLDAEAFMAAFPGSQVTVYKNGNIVVRGLGYDFNRLAQGYDAYLVRWSRQSNGGL